MTDRPIYRVLDIAPGQRYFDCQPLRATISSKACAQRWGAAEPTSQCHACSIGRMHDADHSPKKQVGRRKIDTYVSACLRFGRTDLRIIKLNGVCVSCSNREAEWRKGRNAKGKPPIAFQPLHRVEVALERADGSRERRVVEALHNAEAVGRVLSGLSAGEHLLTDERRLTAWNKATREFEIVCERCGTQGLVLERLRSDGTLQRHAWCCSGEPLGGNGWRVAEVRKLPLALDVDTAATWLGSDPDPSDVPVDFWMPIGHPCRCNKGQIEGLLTKPGGRWVARCRTCGSASKDGSALDRM